MAFGLDFQVEVYRAPLIKEGPMFGSRRQLLLFVVAALSAVCLWPRSLAAQESSGSAPISQPRVVEPKNPPEPDGATRALLAEQNQKAIKKDVEKL